MRKSTMSSLFPAILLPSIPLPSRLICVENCIYTYPLAHLCAHLLLVYITERVECHFFFFLLICNVRKFKLLLIHSISEPKTQLRIYICIRHRPPFSHCSLCHYHIENIHNSICAVSAHVCSTRLGFAVF